MTSEEKVRHLIAEKYGTHAALAEEIGVSRAAISQIVSGQTTRATARYSVASALGVDVSEIWPEEPAVAE